MTTLIQPRHLLSLSRHEKLGFLKSFDHIISDIDGVVWKINQPIKGSAQGFAKLRNYGKKLTLITNNSSFSEEDSLNKLKRLGIEIEPHNFIYPPKSIIDYLKSVHLSGLIYVIGTQHLKSALKKEGFQVVDGPHEIKPETPANYLSQFECKDYNCEDIKAVIFDFDFNLNIIKLMRASLILKKSNCMLICGVTDLSVTSHDNVNVIGPGVFVRALQSVNGCNMIDVGKPGRLMVNALLHRYKISQPERVLLIGDALEQDIAFGKSAGFQTLLTLSGVTSKEDVAQQSTINCIPDYYIDSIKDFIAFFKEL